MSKTPSDKLFQLIRSLTGPELRYVSLYLNRQAIRADNKYLQLFRTISGQKVMDESSLRKKVYGKSEINSRKFSELKAYTYNLILTALQFYDGNSSVKFKVDTQLQQIRVLFKRSHYRDCLDLLKKSKKLIIKYELFLQLIDVLNWEKKIAYAREDIAFLDEELQRIDEEEQACVARVRNLSTYRNILYQLIISRRKYAVLRSAEKQTKLAEILNHPLLISPEKARSYRARVLYYRIKSNGAYSMLDYDDFYTHSRAQIDLMEAHPYLLKEDISAYIYGMTNLMLACGLLNRFDELEANLLIFKALKGDSTDDSFRIFKHYYALSFRLCIQKGEFAEGWELLKDHFKELDKYQGQSFERGSFYFQYFYLSFGKENYDDALSYLNLWLNLPRSIEREDLQSLARMLNLILHYEMNNMVLLESLVKNTHRYLRRRNQAYAFEKHLLHFFQQVIKNNYRTSLKAALEALRKDFAGLAEHPSEKVMLQYFDFLSWIESKVTRQPFAEVVAKNYRRNVE